MTEVQTCALPIYFQQAMFMKNVSMLGGALLLLHFGAGPLSIDHARALGG